MKNGWIKLHRKLRDSEIWKQKPFDKRSAWIDLLLRANHSDNKILIGNLEIKIKEGQIFTSGKQLAKDWGWSQHKVTNFQEILYKLGQIGKPERKSKYTLLTISNWELYQTTNQIKELTKEIKRKSKGNQKETNKKVKNDKEINTSVRSKKIAPHKKQIIFSFEEQLWENITDKDKQNWKGAYPACNINIELAQMREWLLSNPEKRKKNYRRFITNWLTRSQERGGIKSKKEELTPAYLKEFNRED